MVHILVDGKPKRYRVRTEISDSGHDVLVHTYDVDMISTFRRGFHISRWCSNCTSLCEIHGHIDTIVLSWYYRLDKDPDGKV